MHVFSSLDDCMLHLTGAIAGRHAFFDKFVVKFLDLESIRLLPLIIVLIYLWYRGDEKVSARTTAFEAAGGMFLAVVVSRLVQNLSPLRLRPLHGGDPAFVAPIGTNMGTLEHWSSFPSDHAALSFALSTALWLLAWPLGALAYAWSVLVVCLPRIYAGYHYASDVLGGALIGVVVAVCVRRLLPSKAAAARASNVAAHYPGLFNAGLFILAYFFATMFHDVRAAAHGLFQ
ncbi:MAG: phosphatase PAP2 family protein [Parafilimonas terrae]|nr:phosphatase PAP2 family protein [Parafilimonas terrae]